MSTNELIEKPQHSFVLKGMFLAIEAMALQSILLDIAYRFWDVPELFVMPISVFTAYSIMGLICSKWRGKKRMQVMFAVSVLILSIILAIIGTIIGIYMNRLILDARFHSRLR